MSDSFERRIGFDGDVGEVVRRTVTDYGIGELEDYGLIQAGFQDYNIRTRTSQGEFLLKIFAQNRDQQIAQRYVDIMQAAISAGVNHPELFKDSEGNGLHTDVESKLMMAVLGFIPGSTFKDLGRAPSDDELAKIAEQAVKINAIEMQPSYLFDSWAIPNIRWMLDQVSGHLDPDGLTMAKQAIERYEALDIDQLPTAFVHGDIIQTNTIVGEDDKIYIIDFACANIYPRVQELAVMAGNLMHDGKTSLQDRLTKIRELYLRAGARPFTELEEKSLYDYSVAATAMEFLGGHYERYISKDTSPEVEHWIQVGKTGLQEALKH